MTVVVWVLVLRQALPATAAAACHIGRRVFACVELLVLFGWMSLPLPPQTGDVTSDCASVNWTICDSVIGAVVVLPLSSNDSGVEACMVRGADAIEGHNSTAMSAPKC